jgi:hypothetical protein
LSKEVRVIETTKLPRIGAVVMLFGFVIYVVDFMSQYHPYLINLASYESISVLAFVFLAGGAILAWTRKTFVLTMLLVFVVLIMEYFVGVEFALVGGYDIPPTMFGFFVTLVGAIIVASARQEFT